MSPLVNIALLGLYLAASNVQGQQHKCEDRDLFVKSEFDVVQNDDLPLNCIRYYLFTKRSPIIAQEIIHGNDSSLLRSHFSKEKQTKVSVHGWIGNAFARSELMVKDAFLSTYDVNVILVDWSKDADLPYDNSSMLIPSIGKQIATFLDWLVDIGVETNSIHLIGFSLGAHVVGSAARHFTKGMIEYVTGLDPAKDHWIQSNASLSRKDAKYVEVIHTATDCVGLTEAIGHNDFYPNGGGFMSGCETDFCSHERSYEYFAESLKDDSFAAWSCPCHEAIALKMCSLFTTLRMGGILPKPPNGIFYLDTNPQSPYSKFSIVNETSEGKA